MNKLETLKCIELTSQRQADNGTICYHDPETGCDYLSYESGYIRRSYKTPSPWIPNKMRETIYQLNPQSKGYYISEYTGNIYETTARVMIHNPQERLDRLARAVVNYRKNK
ncbi:hypothetical protein OAE73_00215 [bacterium]|nr:hypothetical protein [bacterium]